MDYLAISTALNGLSLSLTLALVAVVMGLGLLLEAVRCFQLNRTEAMMAFCADMDAEVVDFHEVHAISIAQGRSLFTAPVVGLDHFQDSNPVVEVRPEDLVTVLPAMEDIVAVVSVKEVFVTSLTELETQMFAIWASPVMNR